MDRQLVERLLIDRAVGALSPDVEALLAAYLATDPGCRVAAAQLDETARLARQALADGAADAPLPRLNGARLAAAARRARWQQAAGRTLAMAACLLLGFGLAHRMPPTSLSHRTDPRVATVVMATSAEPAVAGGFWSRRALTQRAGIGAAARDQSRLIWASPITQPRKAGAS